jgi:hypothetical protein
MVKRNPTQPSGSISVNDIVIEETETSTYIGFSPASLPAPELVRVVPGVAARETMVMIGGQEVRATSIQVERIGALYPTDSQKA